MRSAGRGALVLLAGEAGIGKTRLAEEVAAASDALALRGAASPAATLPYGPMLGALRGYLRAAPGALASCGPLQGHLALLLPELGPAVAESDRATLFESLRCALATIAAGSPGGDPARRPAVVRRRHPGAARRARRPAARAADPRGGRLPLRRGPARASAARPAQRAAPRPGAARARARAARRRGDGRAGRRRSSARPLSPALARTVYDRTQGVPFFVEELAGALESGGRLTAGARGLELAGNGEIPVPETIRDAVLLRAAGLSDDGARRRRGRVGGRPALRPRARGRARRRRRAAELLDQRARGRDRAGRAAPSATRWPATRSTRTSRGRGAGRCTGAWPRPSRPAAVPGVEVASHWLAAREGPRALDALLRALDELAALHAYRDEARAARRALELWPDGEREGERIALLERYARSAELAGDLTEATRAWREAVAARRAEGVGRALADAQRHLASVYELRGDRERALAARRVAADSFADQRPAGGGGRRAAGRRRLPAERRQARRGGRPRARGRRGGAARRAHRPARPRPGPRGRGDGQGRRARRRRRDGPRRALARAGPRAHAAGRRALPAPRHGARDARATTAARTRRSPPRSACAAPATPTRSSTSACRASPTCCASSATGTPRSSCATSSQAGDVRPDDTLVADGVLGAIHAFRGEPARARPLLLRSLDTASRLDVVSMQLDTAASLACLEDQTRRPRRGGRALPLRARALGAQRGPPLRRLGPALGRVLLRRAAAPAPRPAPAPTRWRGSRPTPAIPTRAPRSPTRWAETALLDDDAGDRRRAARARAGAAGDARHPLRARPDPAARRRRPRRRRASASSALERLAERLPDRAPPRRPPAGHARRRGDGAPGRVGRAPARAPRGRRARRRRALAPRGRGHAPARRRAHEPRDRARALPQPAHGRRARAQHLRQARLPLARRGDDARGRARAARVAARAPRTRGGPPPGPTGPPARRAPLLCGRRARWRESAPCAGGRGASSMSPRAPRGARDRTTRASPRWGCRRRARRAGRSLEDLGRAVAALEAHFVGARGAVGSVVRSRRRSRGRPPCRRRARS